MQGIMSGVTRSTWTCPECDSPGYLCAKSDHGVVDGPALHCTRFPRHNEFDVAEFGRWKAGEHQDCVLCAEGRTPADHALGDS